MKMLMVGKSLKQRESSHGGESSRLQHHTNTHVNFRDLAQVTLASEPQSFTLETSFILQWSVPACEAATSIQPSPHTFSPGQQLLCLIPSVFSHSCHVHLRLLF